MGAIHDKIKELRTKKGLKQKDIAKAAGITIAAAGRIENGQTKEITIEKGIAIAKVLGVSFVELFEVEAGEDNNKELADLYKQIEELTQKVELYRNLANMGDSVRAIQKKENQELQNLRMLMLLIEYFEILDHELFSKHNKHILGDEEPAPRYSLRVVENFFNYHGKNSTQEIVKYVDLQKYMQSSIFDFTVQFQEGSRWTKQEIIKWVQEQRAKLNE
jgi:transcriptional regulator with XRE-family HTH domain